MREQVFINEFSKIWQSMKGLAQGFQITTISQSVRDKALENLLISKGLFTKAELEAEVQKEAQVMVEEANKAKAESSVIVPTSESRIILPGASEIPPVGL